VQLNIKAIVGNNMAIEYATGTTEEARSFLRWLDSMDAAKTTAMAEKPVSTEAFSPEVTTQVTTQVTKEVEAVTRDMCAKRAIELVNTKGREAFNAVIAKFNAKRVGEVPEDQLAALYAALGE
jgi:hypothetical protein